MQNIVKCFCRPEDDEQRASYTCPIGVPMCLMTVTLCHVMCILDEYLPFGTPGPGYLLSATTAFVLHIAHLYLINGDPGEFPKTSATSTKEGQQCGMH